MKKFMIVAVACAVVSGAVAKDAAFQMSLTPDIAIQDRETSITGVSIGVWNENPSPKFNAQFGIVNGATGDSVGIQWMLFFPSVFNYAENYTGAQLGMVNYTSGTMTGLQWGMVNYAASAKNCLQIGLVNIIADNEWFKDFPQDLAKGMVIVNWSFGGAE